MLDLGDLYLARNFLSYSFRTLFLSTLTLGGSGLYRPDDSCRFAFGTL